MSKSANRDLEIPKVNVSAKSALNRSILDQGWGEWGWQLKYSRAWRGGEVIFVNPRYTSQTCPACLYRAKDNHLSQAEFKCTSCNYMAHADYVGAINVLRAGHARLG